LTDFFPGDEKKSKPLDSSKDKKKQKEAPGKSHFEEDIDLIDEEGLHEDHLHGDDFDDLRDDESDMESDENFESFKEDDYPADEEEEEMSFDDPFDNLDDLEEDDKDDEGSLF